MGSRTDLLAQPPGLRREVGVCLPDIVDALECIVGSVEPAVVFQSVAHLCEPLGCSRVGIAMSEGGECDYVITQQLRPTEARGEHRSTAFGGITTTSASVVTDVHGQATETHPAYEGVLVLDFVRPGPSHAILGQLLVDRATALVDVERLTEIAQIHRARAENLEIALNTSRDIGVAMGILMSRHHVTEDQAFDLLRRASQHDHRKIRDVAQDTMRTGEIVVTHPAAASRRHRANLGTRPHNPGTTSPTRSC